MLVTLEVNEISKFITKKFYLQCIKQQVFYETLPPVSLVSRYRSLKVSIAYGAFCKLCRVSLLSIVQFSTCPITFETSYHYYYTTIIQTSTYKLGHTKICARWVPNNSQMSTRLEEWVDRYRFWSGMTKRVRVFFRQYSDCLLYTSRCV